MKLYKTTSSTGVISFQGSLTEASKARNAPREPGVPKPTSQEINVPVTKDALLDWLNANACGKQS